MKKILLSLIIVFVAFGLSAQAPQSFKYQTVVRDAAGVIEAGQSVSFQISILEGVTPVYVEKFVAVTTNNYGLVTLENGTGTLVSGSFTTIDWENDGPFFLMTEIDMAGGETFTEVGTSELLSVPFALNAKTAENAYWVKNVNDISYNDGKVGIGVAAPTAKLDIRGTMYAAGTAPFGTFTFVETTDSHADVHESILTVQNISGGVSSQANIKFDAGPGGHGKAIISGAYDGSDEEGKLTFKVRNGTTSYADALTLRSSGNVGINETNPDSNFHVNGNAHITGDLTVDGAVRVSVSPVDDDDAVNKAYVHAFIQKLSEKGVIVVDVDENIYATVRMGSQVWMAENLKTIHYNDGTPITPITDNAAWAAATDAPYCWYSNDAATYKDVYGALYNGYAAQKANICPTGWHVPTFAEMGTLQTFLGGESEAGTKLKETGTDHWNSPNPATNETGYTAVAGGNRSNSTGLFANLKVTSQTWSSNGSDNFGLDNTTTNMYLSVGGSPTKLGFTIRCMTD